MIKKLRKWLITKHLPELASVALVQEIEAQRHQLEACREDLDGLRQEKARLESYIYGMERALRSHRVEITVKGGAP